MLQISIGALGQAGWPGAGDVDDCWAVSDLQGVHASAPWLQLYTVPRYREAAGNPDRPGPTGGTIEQSARALRKLYPSLAFAAYVAPGSTGLGLRFSDWSVMVKAGRPSSVEIIAGELPPRLRHGFAGRHRILAFWDGTAGYRILDPLAAPHSRAEEIAKPELEASIGAAGPGVRAIVFPTEAEAFLGHPLLEDAITQAGSLAQARLDQVKAKVAALAADVADD